MDEQNTTAEPAAEETTLPPAMSDPRPEADAPAPDVADTDPDAAQVPANEEPTLDAQPDGAEPDDVDAALAALASLDGLGQRPAPAPQNSLDPDRLAQIIAQAQAKSMEPLVQQNRAVNALLQQAAQAQQAARVAASLPKPPGENATLADITGYQNQMLQYHQQQSANQMREIAQALRAEMQQTLNPLLGQLQQQAAQAQAQQRQQAVAAATAALAAKPGFEFMRSPMKASIVRSLYEQVKGQGLTFQQVAEEFAQEFGFAKPAAQAQAAVARKSSANALQAARARTASRQVLPGKGSSTGAKGAAMGVVAKAKASGMWDALSPELQAYKELQDRKQGLA